LQAYKKSESYTAGKQLNTQMKLKRLKHQIKIPLIILTNGNTLKQLLAKAAISIKNKSKWSKPNTTSRNIELYPDIENTYDLAQDLRHH
jgi:hypothetical protein